MKRNSQFVPILIFALYLGINLSLIALNWGIFSTVLNVNVGFGTASIPPFLVLFIVGLVSIASLWFYEFQKDLKNHIRFLEEESKILRLEKDAEIGTLKTEAIQQKLTSNVSADKKEENEVTVSLPETT